MATFAAATADTLPGPAFLLPVRGAPRTAAWRLALQCGFLDAVRLTRAEVGLLHLCGEAFLFTVAVHGLEPQWHMHVGVSFWDEAMQHVLRGGSVTGCKSDGSAAGAIARRLRATSIPEGVIGVPVLFAGQVEAVMELGRHTEAFRPGDSDVALRAVRSSLQRAAA